MANQSTQNVCHLISPAVSHPVHHFSATWIFLSVPIMCTQSHLLLGGCARASPLSEMFFPWIVIWLALPRRSWLKCPSLTGLAVTSQSRLPLSHPQSLSIRLLHCVPGITLIPLARMLWAVHWFTCLLRVLELPASGERLAGRDSCLPLPTTVPGRARKKVILANLRHKGLREP